MKPILALLALLGAASQMAAARPEEHACLRTTLTGEVAAGQEWSAEIGQGWRFRVLPLAAFGQGYTGWDLVMDRVERAGGQSSMDGMDGPGYPDALLLATPPFGSLNEREIGTTYGLRAQDAIAWEPRRFHFLTSTADLARARNLFHNVMPAARSSVSRSSVSDTSAPNAAASSAHASGRYIQTQPEAASELLKLIGRASAGEFSVLDAKLVAGVADPPAFARQWAESLDRVPHTFEQTLGPATPRGELRWIRFRVILWLPARWSLPESLHAKVANCAQ